jgi:apolipoprotein D and lipocalin family protein
MINSLFSSIRSFGLTTALMIQPVLLMSTKTASATPALPTVENVDISRYQGRWYEIASIPQVFSRGCQGTFAEYTLRDDGNVTVYNQCNKGSLTGPLSTIRGTAYVMDSRTNAVLGVRFFLPFLGRSILFLGDYRILDLDNDYKSVLVGSLNRKSLWILAREKTLDPVRREQMTDKAESLGFDVSQLQSTIQLPEQE